MATLNIYKLRFTSPLHIGDRRDDYSISQKTISSDTMYAALTASLAKTGHTIPDNGDLGFCISSLFPYYQGVGEKPVYFFPKPMYQIMPKLNDLTKGKAVKKVAWMDADYFVRNLKGEELFDESKGNLNDIQGIYLSSKKIKNDFVYSQVSQRVTVSRTGTEDAMPFYMDRIYFKDESGLYFIADGNLKLLEKALSVLKEEGIGTDRCVGNGFFEYSVDSIELGLPSMCSHVISLSSFIPESKEQFADMLDSDKVAYDFERKGGWITTYPHNSFRKNVIYGLTQGSVLKHVSSDTITSLGRIVDLRPKINFAPVNHPIWRCGKSLFLPIKL